MCFSATASFVAGAALSTAGVVTLKKAKHPSQYPLAAMPLLFGVQQLVEGVVWSTPHLPVVNGLAATVYVMFSHILWPSYVPFAVLAMEKEPARRTILRWILVLGISISLWLFWYIIQGPIWVSMAQNCLVYNVNVPALPYGLAAYVLVTCFSCFVSSHKYVRLFGATLFFSLGIALWAYRQAFYSVWCFFGALLSLIIYVHLHQDALQHLKKKFVKG